MTFFRELIYVLSPLILSNSIHMIIVKKDWFACLNIAIQKKIFGINKTLRGFVVVPVLNLILTALILIVLNKIDPKLIILGLFFGLVYMIFELPNSYLKRRIGIAPGVHSGKHKVLFTILDKTDSAFGIALCYHIFLSQSWFNSIVLFACGSLLHFIFSWILLLVRIKKSF